MSDEIAKLLLGLLTPVLAIVVGFAARDAKIHRANGWVSGVHLSQFVMITALVHMIVPVFACVYLGFW